MYYLHDDYPALPVISEVPVQHEPDAQLGVPFPPPHEPAKASEGNVLVRSNYYYRSEFEVVGARIMSMSAYYDGLARCAEIVDAGGEIDYYFGMNQEICFRSMEQINNGLYVQPITPAEEAVVRKFWHDGEIGMPIMPWDAIETNED